MYGAQRIRKLEREIIALRVARDTAEERSTKLAKQLRDGRKRAKRLVAFAASQPCQHIFDGEPECSGRVGWDPDVVDSPWCVPCLARRARPLTPESIDQ